ncbi:RNA-binding S4 domain-containing protein [Oecophyllibacter saccharovorans]|uniref:RNA-binding S4 domain-containing protein n=1 Tax=Oecophyllibacter saccharovorans TaxID=2558360 RepID=A0A506UQC2_9PROT|nr:S4 domain-containing protein [Oecophyllibacter saccharovorans]TPW35499.1 RNA-binding S4 domain-containing protein [Oecophyllibacter saccharovorans]
MNAPPETEPDSAQRLDLWLYYARLAKTRALCARFIESGKVRLNGQRLRKAHTRVRPGDVLVFPAPHGRPGERAVHVWRVRTLTTRRGPAAEARLTYEVVEENEGESLEKRA